MAKLVQFEDGTFGVRFGFLSYKWLGVDGKYTWNSSEYVNKYCKFPDQASAEEASVKVSTKYKILKDLG